MMNKFALLMLALLFNPLANAQAPWEQHGKLKVSKNGHFIQHENGTPFLWLGDTGWGMFQQLTRAEVDLYLDSRSQLGFSVIQSVAHWSPHGGGIDRSPDNAPNAYGHRPFTGKIGAPNTSEPLIVAGGTATAPNDYWDHADYIVAAIHQRNMYLALLPAWSAQLVTISKEYTAKEATSYGEFLGHRYKDFANIIWVLGGDTKAQMQGYDKYQKYFDYDDRHIYRAMAEGLGLGVTGKPLKWHEEHPGWDELFLTYHPNGDYPYGSAQWFHHDVWQDANGVEVWKEVDDVYRTMLDHYQLTGPAKPALFLEGSYEFGTYRHECGWVTPVKVRRQLYQTFLALGAGHTYGAAPIWAMRGTGGDYNCGYSWQQALNFPGVVQVTSIARDILQAHDWPYWQPNGKVLSGFSKGENLKTAITNKAANMAMIYFANNSHITVNNIFKHQAKAYWLDPRDGKMIDVEPFAANEARVVAPPERWEDALLVLRTDRAEK